MSRENVEALRRATDAVGGVDPVRFVALLDPDVDWESDNSAAPPDLLGTYQGIDGVLQYFTRWEQAWEDWDSEFEEIEAVESHVISRVHIWGHGRHTGIKADWRMWQAWTFREGKVIRYRDFDTKAEALEAVGLRE